MNSVYGFKNDAPNLDDDEGDQVNEAVQKYHRTLNRLKRDVERFKEETQNNIIDLRPTLIINDLLASENVIVVEALKWTAINNVYLINISVYKMWSSLSLMKSVYGFKDDEHDDGDGAIEDRETAQKDHRALNRLKHNVYELKLELERYRRESQTFTEETQTFMDETQILFKDEIRESMRDVVRIKSDVAGLNTDVAGMKRDAGRLKKIVKK